MKHNILKYPGDVRLSVLDIEMYIEKEKVTSSADIEKNKLLLDGLCRRFAIIGEAIFQANKIDKNIPITDKTKIMGLRHIIVHDYDLVRAPDLWNIIRFKLPALKQEIILLIEKYEQESL